MGKFSTDPKKLTTKTKFSITYTDAKAKDIKLEISGDIKGNAKGKGKVTLKGLQLDEPGSFKAEVEYTDEDGMELEDFETYSVF